MKPIIDYEYLHAWAAIEADLLKFVLGAACGVILFALFT
jgi:hypothetical protein